MLSNEVIELLAITAEICDRPMPKSVAMVMAGDLEGYDEGQIVGALKRCRMELQGKLTTQAILSRLDDGRPSPDEAYAMYPKDEYQTAILTTEMSEAMEYAGNCEDDFSKRRCFVDTYTRLVRESREQKRPVKWFASLGWDKDARDDVLKDAVQKGRLTAAHVQPMLAAPMPESVLALVKSIGHH